MGPLIVPFLQYGLPAIGSLFASLFGAHKQSSSAERAAKLQTQAQLEAARLSKQAADDALAETRRESDRSWASNEAARRGNYDISAARERRLGNIGEMVGLGPREIPAYVPDPGAVGGSGATAGGPVPERPADLQSALDVANKTAYGYAKHTDPSYWPAHWAKDPEYAWKRMLGWQAGPSDAAKMGPYAGAGTAPASSGRTIQDILTTNSRSNPAGRRRTPLTPALTPGSVAQYAVGRY